ncbi:MAG: bifunctional UDP-N-acetylglucosamine diphosphorylase/glucosamine-1-phosphate N-acetyltransferase GlmU [Candidatus Riflebacteria bacterium HGW-Riflebacteria-2]|jgi:bifunctional UDP-N-acetylglucosamine pyrophosphorylase/glucosamine-1-phosphate N-acetyltransferase|nr:MAG: bifunctional UDP-N-acetylglucosamine diphosphorylase/glucosamine-1-phosphate N-acetyltransferase GlmU [Candidatus Riflebacteria bacterium HGW-Riflebacteria-2]
MTAKLQALILAAGKGTRMKSELPKVVHPILGKPMVAYVIEAVKAVGCDKVTLIIGYKSELVRNMLTGADVSFVEQPQQMGTGHAVQCFAKEIATMPEHLLVVCGDTPLISTSTLRQMIEMHNSQKPAITMMTLNMENPGNYGRILRKDGKVFAIREARDCSAEELKVKEVNLAVYLFEGQFLKDNIFKLTASNQQKEYYLTDLVELAVQKGLPVVSCIEKDESSTLGINSRQHLADVSAILQQQILDQLMSDGVTITSPQNTFIGPDVNIAPDTVIHPGTMISGRCSIGRDCVVGPNTHISDSTIGNGCNLEACIIKGASITDNSNIEPFSLVEG